MKNLAAIILVGGLGTRLRPVVSDRPKALAPVNGIPFLHLQLDLLARNGFADIILAIGYRGDMIQESVGDMFAGMRIRYSEEKEPLGTGGALKKALGLCNQDHIFALNGDTWLDMDYQEADNCWQGATDMVISAVKVEDAKRYGALEIKNNMVTGFKEKGVDGEVWINAGCYILSRNEFAQFPSDAKFSFESDYLPGRLGKAPSRLYRCSSFFIDMGTPDSYRAISRMHLPGGIR